MNRSESHQLSIEMKDLYEDKGFSLSQLAERFSRTRMEVRRRVLSVGSHISPRGRPMIHTDRNRNLHCRWRAMKHRCTPQNGKASRRYGDRGIRVCDEWIQDFNVFQQWAYSNGFAVDLELDRIDNNGDYSPVNCRWTTSKVNANNKESTIMLTAFGETKPLTEWPNDHRCPHSYYSLRQRIKMGVPRDQIITRPKWARSTEVTQ
jgi:hypothetical protein